jgi:tetratricopeptide (TPR) repeat protein
MGLRTGWIWAMLLGSAAGAQEDRVRLKGVEREGRVTAISCKSVSVRIAGIPTPQELDREDVLGINFDPDSFPRAVAGGVSAMGRNDYARAIEQFKKETGAEALWQQVALYRIAECHQALHRPAEWAQALVDLKTKVPENFYLFEIYYSLTDYYVRTQQAAKAEALVKEMEQHIAQHGHDAWTADRRFLNATVLRAQGKLKEALGALSALTSNPRVGESARMLELRCLLEAGQAAEARAKATQVAKGKATPALLTAAYNVLGDCERADGKHREAMFCYLRGIAEFDASPGPEHEYALAHAAIAMAEVSKGLKQEADKELYLGRARRLQERLLSDYGSSELSRKVEAAFK